MSHAVLAVEGIAKRFGEVVAVRGLSFEVGNGEVLGLLGPNGAGKTTAIRMICGLLAPDAGCVRLDGRPLRLGAEDRCRIGLCPQELVLWERLTCVEQLAFAGEMCGLDRREARRRGERLLDELGLLEEARTLAGELSGGMKRRLNLALALVHGPDVVVLDEPGAGLDPQGRIRVRDVVRALGRRKAVLLTTHDMDEADRLADRVAIIDRGALLVSGAPEALKRGMGAVGVIEVRLEEGEGEAAAEAVVGLQGGAAEPSPGLLTVRAERPAEVLPEVLARLAAQGVTPRDVRLRGPSLEDVFIGLTGRGLRE